MNDNYIDLVVDSLKGKGILLDKGLTDSEVREIEGQYQFQFPPDLKLFLQTILPLSKEFVNWRKISEKEMLSKLNLPYEGICFDVEYNNFWMDDFGPKPKNLQEAFKAIKEFLNKVPKLIPLYSHRYMPCYPYEEGNPVFSVHQTDIICYGSDLFNYFENEFHNLSIESVYSREIKQIPFWSKFID